MTVTTERTELLGRCPLFTGLDAAQLELRLEHDRGRLSGRARHRPAG